MAVFCAFEHKINCVLFVSLVGLVFVPHSVFAEEVHPTCDAGYFAIADILTPGLTYPCGEIEKCPIGSYRGSSIATTGTAVTQCSMCNAGQYTTAVGQTSNTCVACPNATGVSGWKTRYWARISFGEGGVDELCNPDTYPTNYCNIGRVVGLCEIDSCSTGYTLGTSIDYTKSGSGTYAMKLGIDEYNVPDTTVCIKDYNSTSGGTYTWASCTDNKSIFAGMNHGEWATYFSNSSGGGNLINLGGYYIYGKSKCINTTGTSGNADSYTTSGGYCWCKATAYKYSSGTIIMPIGGQPQTDYTPKYVVEDAMWTYYGSNLYSGDATTCNDNCANACAYLMKSNQNKRTAMLKDGDSKPVFLTVCGADTYTVTYNAGSHGTGGYTDTNGATYGQNYTVPTAANNAITPNTGYSFVGFNTAQNQTTSNFPDAAATPWTRTSSLTVYAAYTPCTQTVVYEMNGGTHGSSHPTVATFNTPFNVSIPTKDEYVFTGWNISGMTSGLTHYKGTVSTSLTSFGTGTTASNVMGTWFKNLNSVCGEKIIFEATWDQCTKCDQGTGCTCNLSVVNNTCTYTTGAESGWTLVSGPDTATPVCSTTATYHPGNCHYNSNLTYVVNGILGGSNYNVNMTSTVTNQLVDGEHRAFNGWATTPGGQVIYPVSVGGTVNSVSGPLNFYGDCDNIITLEWDWTSGVFDEEENMCTYGESGGIDVPALVSAPTGYIFGGWKVVRHQCYEEYPNCTPMP